MRFKHLKSGILLLPQILSRYAANSNAMVSVILIFVVDNIYVQFSFDKILEYDISQLFTQKFCYQFSSGSLIS